MTKRINRWFSIATMILLGMAIFNSFYLSANAADINQLDARKLRESGHILPLEKITALAKSIKSGSILETELERKGAGYLYEIELLDAKGQVWELKLDAKTGKLIKLESED